MPDEALTRPAGRCRPRPGARPRRRAPGPRPPPRRRSAARSSAPPGRRGRRRWRPRAGSPSRSPSSRSVTSSPLPGRPRRRAPRPGPDRAPRTSPASSASSCDQPPHLPLGLARGAGDRLERLGRRLGVVRREPLAGARLHDHHADRVGHDVVQLRRDPGPLVAHRQRRVRLALVLQLAARAASCSATSERSRSARPAPQPATTMKKQGDRRVADQQRAGDGRAGQDHARPRSPIRRPSYRPATNPWRREEERDGERSPPGTSWATSPQPTSRSDASDPGQAREAARAEAEQQRRAATATTTSGALGSPSERGGGAHGAAAQRDPADRTRRRPHVRPRRRSGSDTRASARPPSVVASSAPVVELRPLARPLDGRAAPRRRSGPATASSSASSAKRTPTSTSGASCERVEQVLHHPVGRQLDARRQRARVALDGEPRARRPSRAPAAPSSWVSVGWPAISAAVRRRAARRPPRASPRACCRLSVSISRQRGGGRLGVGRVAAVGELGQLAEAALEQVVELARQPRAVGRRPPAGRARRGRRAARAVRLCELATRCARASARAARRPRPRPRPARRRSWPRRPRRSGASKAQPKKPMPSAQRRPSSERSRSSRAPTAKARGTTSGISDRRSG